MIQKVISQNYVDQSKNSLYSNRRKSFANDSNEIKSKLRAKNPGSIGTESSILKRISGLLVPKGNYGTSPSLK